MSGTTLYGYSINEGLEYNITSRTLINVNNGKIKRLGKTKARLFAYLLANAERNYILDEDIFIDVFENNGLRCSKSYLWEMIRQLHLAFISVGYVRAPVRRYEHKGYLVDSVNVVEIYIIKKTNKSISMEVET
ncbi:hypothetical protein ACRUMN_03420 [Kluyvera cryocrescens]|uniref:hypothetical protein n=1 Tax=Kluyvera cryocrescens TaxID=580 RepID=UPI003D7F898F